jgi:hypothetical protein
MWMIRYVIKLWKESKRASGFPASVISKPAPRFISSLCAKAKNHLRQIKKFLGQQSLYYHATLLSVHTTADLRQLLQSRCPSHSKKYHSIAGPSVHDIVMRSWKPRGVRTFSDSIFLFQSNEHPYYGQIGATDLSSNSFGGVELLFMGHLHRQP